VVDLDGIRSTPAETITGSNCRRLGELGQKLRVVS
jgi:hypothetical protein